MPVLPVLSGRQVVRVFEKLGWTVARQRGSHIILVKKDQITTLSVPDHKEVARGMRIPDEVCHRFQSKAATRSTASLPLMPRERCHRFR